MTFCKTAPGVINSLLCAVAAAVLVPLAGCGKSTQTANRGPSRQGGATGGLFDSVAESLDRMEQFETGQILKQICDRLNQWQQQEKPHIAWQPDPLVAALPAEYQKLFAMKLLDSTQYHLPDDAWFLQQSVWLRDISRRARGDQFDDLAVAERLFDWTVRHIELEPDKPAAPEVIRHRPFEILLYGRGTAAERAWIFMLLARQQGLDVVMLAPASASDKKSGRSLPALASGGELYLFDPALGLPIPGAGGKGVATLSAAIADPQLLRRLDLDAEHPYPLRAEDLEQVVAYVEGSPIELSRRMALVESRLAGKHKMAIVAQASAVAERVSKIPHVSDARLWPVPFEIALWQSKLDDTAVKAANREMYPFQALPTLMVGRAGETIHDTSGKPVFQPQPTLLTARTLDFKGQWDGDKGAKIYYLKARPNDKTIDEFHLPESVAKQVLEKGGQVDIARIEAGQVLVMRRAKQAASFWLGLIHYEQQDFPEAIDFFANRTLKANPKGIWAAAASYNLGRSYEASGQKEKAIAIFEADKSSPQSTGNQLRARWLKEEHATAAK